MATTPSNFNRLQTSSPGTRADSGLLVTTVTPHRPFLDRQPVPRAANLFPMPNEPEDAHLTGGTRSLDRRLLALNLSGSLPMRELRKPTATEHVASPQHSAVA
jgi:hypothetical protein